MLGCGPERPGPPVSSNFFTWNRSEAVAETNGAKLAAPDAGGDLSQFPSALVPGEGFEPPTFGLQNRCTATVLTRQSQWVTGIFALPLL
jgi:hypothetical protein